MTGIGVLLVRTSASVVWERCNCARNSMTATAPRLDKGLPMIATRDNRRFTGLVSPRKMFRFPARKSELVSLTTLRVYFEPYCGRTPRRVLVDVYAPFAVVR